MLDEGRTMNKKEVELIDYLNILWKRRLVIILGTLACMIIAAAVSFILKPVYEIDAIVQPGKFMTQNQTGNYDEVIVESPQQIANSVKLKSYDALIQNLLKIDETEMPEIEANNIPETLLARIWLRTKDREMGKNILAVVIKFIKEDIDKKINIETQNTETLIRDKEKEINGKMILIGSKQIEKEMIKSQLVKMENKLKILDNRKEEINAEMGVVRKRIESMERDQTELLKKEGRAESDALGLLLYSNEVQQNYRYYDSLQEMIAAKDLAEQEINIDIDSNKEQIRQLDNQIEGVKNDIEKINNNILYLKELKGRIDYTKIIKEPTPSIRPVSPKKKLNVLLAGILGLIFVSVGAFLYEYISSGSRGKRDDQG
jgi:LPS O-antigen subunit length determinant protein (WzzB/FepE family)